MLEICTRFIALCNAVEAGDQKHEKSWAVLLACAAILRLLHKILGYYVTRHLADHGVWLVPQASYCRGGLHIFSAHGLPSQPYFATQYDGVQLAGHENLKSRVSCVLRAQTYTVLKVFGVTCR